MRGKICATGRFTTDVVRVPRTALPMPKRFATCLYFGSSNNRPSGAIECVSECPLSAQSGHEEANSVVTHKAAWVFDFQR
jgi:hypothetical protein